ncbi:NAD-dependent protein deacetylase Sirt2 [Drosophila ficusphila]|uniref:NAD-dependent protein deacetylase Sirt2 n=1 Tax=Drosophila ficusphila TaxID=30025 RepID=UPI0007E7C733|nr:NAD-dependent protein deacetylase Sirt2 [Drosophila ficusphila]XP_017048868.1 NAD-dependent protein deacetylase Sirt2 [Drosophila ficusphila]
MSNNERKEVKPTTSDSNSSSSDEGESKDPTMDMIRRFFAHTLNLGGSTDAKADLKVEKVIPDLSFEGFVDHWREHGFRKIVTMVGAGISTSAGIPDFRSPGSGLYSNLKKYKLPHPTAIFDLDYFEKNPAPFFALAKELYPGSFIPTRAHYFVRLLNDKGLLQRHYTQNIDTLDRLTGLPEDKIIEAHGSFHTNHCLKCRKEYDMAWMKAEIFADRLPKCKHCKGVVKPDIVFFGENLPQKFYTSPDEDFQDCDLLIIMGTSLEVQPFASLVQRPGPRCLRLLINRDAVGQASFVPWMDPHERSLLYDRPNNTRDVAFLGDCDAGVLALAKALGWEDDLQKLIDSEKKKLIDKQSPNKNEEQKKEETNQDSDDTASSSRGKKDPSV